MSPKKKTEQQRSEADLEARIRGALQHAFPTLPDDSFEHQTRFTFTIGGKQITVDGTLASKTEARSDILIRHKGVPLAVLELKRQGKPITEADVEQGMSYAALLTPHPPLVIVTNGDDFRFVDWHSAKPWVPADDSAVAVKQLFENAGRAAAYDTRRALDVLLGTKSSVWAPVLHAVTEAVFRELYAERGDEIKPFVPGFLIPRAATTHILSLFNGGKRFVLLQGAPLVGKSNVIRDLWDRTKNGHDFVVLYVEAAGSADYGLFEALADVLQDQLGWSLSRSEAREWLVQLSKHSGAENVPALVLAVDGMKLGQDRIRADLENLTSGSFGKGVRVLVALDEAVADWITTGSRGQTKIGRRAERVTVSTLDDVEYISARDALSKLYMTFMPGAHRSDDLRVPWILRAIVAAYHWGMDPPNETRVAVIPPIVGMELITMARDRFEDSVRLRTQMRAIARAVLDESADDARSASLILNASTVFLVRPVTLRRHISDAVIDEVAAEGVLKLTFPPDREPLYTVRLPELLAEALAGVIKSDLDQRVRSDPTGAADWLIERASRLPLGDVITARALFDYAIDHAGLPPIVVQRLVEHAPTREPRRARGTYLMQAPNGSALRLHLDGDEPVPETEAGEADNDDFLIGNLHAWLILSHLSGVPMVELPSSHPLPSVADALAAGNRTDLELLSILIKSTIPLRLPHRQPVPEQIAMHDLPDGVTIICAFEGIIEPVTLALLRFLGSTGAAATPWVEELMQAGSSAASARLHIALSYLKQDADDHIASWAARMLRELIDPALMAAGLSH